MTKVEKKRRVQNFCGRTRRQFLWETGGGFASVALAGLLGDDGFLAQQSLAAKGLPGQSNRKAMPMDASHKEVRGATPTPPQRLRSSSFLW